MATKATKKKATKKGAKSSYQRVIYVTEDGRIAKVEDGQGKAVRGKKLVKPKEGEEPNIRNLIEWNDDERCVYSASGRCYC
jgi:hypothetical protein